MFRLMIGGAIGEIASLEVIRDETEFSHGLLAANPQSTILHEYMCTQDERMYE